LGVGGWGGGGGGWGPGPHPPPPNPQSPIPNPQSPIPIILKNNLINFVIYFVINKKIIIKCNLKLK